MGRKLHSMVRGMRPVERETDIESPRRLQPLLKYGNIQTELLETQELRIGRGTATWDT